VLRERLGDIKEQEEEKVQCRVSLKVGIIKDSQMRGRQGLGFFRSARRDLRGKLERMVHTRLDGLETAVGRCGTLT
jgi:hypothetical protein